MGEGPFGSLRTPPRDAFRQLDELLPTPTSTRTASGAPGHEYWQQRADYEIAVTLDDQNKSVSGTERITYHNNSPDTLTYLWVQLDQNVFAKNSEGILADDAPAFGMEDEGEISFDRLAALLGDARSECGYNIRSVTDDAGASLPYTIVGTMMRIDLPAPLAPGATLVLRAAWDYKINEAIRNPGRTGYEWFEDDKNAIFVIAAWYPRMAAYSDAHGWHNRQFLGRAEFALEFGDFEVRITAPADHIVAATGVLQNQSDVLTDAQRERLAQAKTAERPVMVVTLDEAKANEPSRSTDTKTWEFKAENVRDFAWASSRKFLWDAWGRTKGTSGDTVMCMAYYPKEAEVNWSKYATQAIAQTIEVYGARVLPYPYPTMSSVNGPVGGMEYPMINFDGARPEKDGTYSRRAKYGLIGVILHETGHNWFPMIINSDERRWAWMDEGFNTFIQFSAEQAWEKDYRSRRGEPKDIVGYMKRADQMPIMTNAESLTDLGNNAYAKTATGLSILRETILGRELFDFAFHEYARRWAFKRPMPADFFRTMEDASGVDLDWFWRGWFFGTDPVDLAITGVRLYRIESMDPEIDKPAKKAREDAEPRTITQQRDDDATKRLDEYPDLHDFYNDYDELDVVEKDRTSYKEFLEKLEPKEKALLTEKPLLYVLDFQNVGGMVMPIILRLTWEGDDTQMVTIPVDIWRTNSERVSKLFLSDKKLVSVEMDPFLQTSDIDEMNNAWPAEVFEGYLKLTKDKKEPNPMQEAKKAAEAAAKKVEEEKKKLQEAAPADTSGGTN